MEWIKGTPHAWEEGQWDGRKSDRVLIQTDEGLITIGTLYEGFMDGHHFKDWYSDSDFAIDEEVLFWIPLPDRI